MTDFYFDKMEKGPYDVAIIGSGPAGLSAALNFKLHNKKVIWFGSSELSQKVEKSEKIANYPGFFRVSGKELNDSFRRQIAEEGLVLTDQLVTTISKTKAGFMILAENDIYDAKMVLLATGAVTAKGFEGEERLLGRGVSYCASCDGFLYPEKTLAIYCGAPKYEHEVAYLADIAGKVYLSTPYKDCKVDLPNVELLSTGFQEILGEDRVEALSLRDGQKVDVDGVFVLRNAVAPASLIPGIELDGPHIKIDRDGRTNIPGCFAAGDCTGRPYQITTAVGEANQAAHAMLEYLSELDGK